jgi:hypothetical protein
MAAARSTLRTFESTIWGSLGRFVLQVFSTSRVSQEGLRGAMKTLKNGARWGDWMLDTDAQVLALDTRIEGANHRYEIDLQTITDSAQMLDWIFQLRMKVWVNNDVMGDLLNAFQDIFRPQTFLCGGGHDKKLDARSHLTRMFAKAS